MAVYLYHLFRSLDIFASVIPRFPVLFTYAVYMLLFTHIHYLLICDPTCNHENQKKVYKKNKCKYLREEQRSS